MARLDVFAAALRALDAGRGVAIATVVGAHGSTPRHLGACCGGSMEIVLTPARPSRVAIATVAETRDARVLETPVDGEPLIVRAPVDGDPRAHEPRLVGGALVERVGAAERAIVFGLGHVARSLGPLLAQLGFAVIVCDDGDTGATAETPPWATRLVESFDAREVERAVGGFGPDDRVLIVTRDHAIDQQLLEQLIAHAGIGYLGMIGSRGKVGRFKKRLEAKGLLDGDAGAARWARLRAPIGLDVGAETPEEIAVAIAAELVAVRRRGTAGAGDWRPRRVAEGDA